MDVRLLLEFQRPSQGPLLYSEKAPKGLQEKVAGKGSGGCSEPWAFFGLFFGTFNFIPMMVLTILRHGWNNLERPVCIKALI